MSLPPILHDSSEGGGRRGGRGTTINKIDKYQFLFNEDGLVCGWGCFCVFCYLLVGGDGDGKHFDSMLLGFVGRLLDAAARLFVPGDGMSVGHHHDVLVLVVVGATERTGTHVWTDDTSLHVSVRVCVCVCACEAVTQ